MALPLDQVKVIDADTHMTEQHDLWTKRAPAEVEGPGAARDAGRGRGHVGGRRRGARPGRRRRRRRQERRQGPHLRGPLRVGDRAGARRGLRPGRARRAHGRHRRVGAGRLPGRGRPRRPEPREPRGRRRAAHVCASRSSTTRTASSKPSRATGCFPMALLPAWDVDACVREAHRAKALGLRGVNLTADPQDVGAPDLASRAWDPLWDACSALELPVHFHIGASLTTMNYFGTYPWDSHDDDTKLAIGGALLFIGNARVVVNIICTGHARSVPRAQDRLGRERRGVDPVHPRSARLRDDRERSAREGCALAARPRSTSSGRSTQPRGSSAPTSPRSSRRSARTTSCSRPTTRTPRACIPTR